MNLLKLSNQRMLKFYRKASRLHKSIPQSLYQTIKTLFFQNTIWSTSAAKVFSRQTPYSNRSIKLRAQIKSKQKLEIKAPANIIKV